MKVWIVCDNNANKTIIPFESLVLAKKYQDQYEHNSLAAEDCLILDENGTEVIEVIEE